MKTCLNFEKLSSSKVQCHTCHHRCVIREGQVGICGVRKNEDGALYLLSYGKIIASHKDPIEKKPFFHFYPGSYAYSIGTLGCNFRCGNCQNFDISQIYGLKGQTEKYGNSSFWGVAVSPREVIEAAQENECVSIAHTYNEPTMFLEYALDVMKLAQKAGLKNVWVSNGYFTPQAFKTIAPYLDAINIDIKSFSDDFYRKNCGARLEPVLENCKRVVENKIWLEATTLLIPGMTDDEAQLKNIARFIKNELGDFIPWHVSAFSGAISWKMRDAPDTSPETVEKAYKIGKKAGLKYVYAGNVAPDEMENTFCQKCGELVFQRSGYAVRREDKKGACPKCGRRIEGEFR